MKYILTIVNNGTENRYETDSRDAVKHLRNLGGDKAIVETREGKTVSAAVRDENGNAVHVTF